MNTNVPFRADVISKIIEIVNNPSVNINANTKFYDIPDMDSLNTMDVVADIEDYYDVVVNLHNVDSTLTINDLAALIVEEVVKQKEASKWNGF